MEKKKLNFRMWFSFILIGFTGQLAWCVENMYLNKFIFSFGGSNYEDMITITVALSAIVAFLATLFMGTLSDKVRKRKLFISLGYILWGVSTASFGLISVEHMKSWFPALSAATLASIFVIVIDAVMTFIGSTANDAAFNAYVTENVEYKDKGKVEGVLSILPLIAMIVLTVGFDGLTSSGHWDYFFFIIGGFASLTGLIAIFLLPKEKKVEKKNEPYFKGLIEGFKIKTIKENKSLYLILLAYLVYGISSQIFFPYIMIYFQYVLNFTGMSFTICLGTVLVVGSLLTVLAGILMDKIERKKVIFPTIIIYIIGLVLISFVKENELIFGILAGIIMMFGYIFLGSVINAIVRMHVPEKKEGSFMGIRMIFAVTLPMVIGPSIAKVLISNFSNKTYTNEYGEIQNLPPSSIWVASAIVLVLILIPLYFYFKSIKNDKNNGITYKIDEKIKEDEIPLNEHPNPYNSRNDFQILNGYWDIKIKKEEELPESYGEKICVPFAVESPLGLGKMVEKDDVIFYHKVIKINEKLNKEHIFLNFLAVDQVSWIFINKKLVYTNYGGYKGFKIDVKDFLDDKNEFDLIVKVKDVTNSSYFARGKQTLSRGGIWYTSTSGIYQSVYLESAPKDYVEDFDISYDIDKKEVYVEIKTDVEGEATLSLNEEEFKVSTNKKETIKLDSMKLWSIKEPNLYNIKIKFKDDEVNSVIGFRKIETKKVDGKIRVLLNNEEILIKGLLDQGYYYKGNLTPSSFSDYLFDIKNIKELGFNCLRKHIKLEMPMFYYYCDKEGILVIQDAINGGNKYNQWTIFYQSIFHKDDYNDENKYKKFKMCEEKAREEYFDNLNYMMKLLKNSPSVSIYTLFNEGRGQFDSKKVYEHAKSIDSSRLFDTTSGWYDSSSSDFYSRHIYILPIRNFKRDRAYFLSEFGGYSLFKKENFYGTKKVGYKFYKNEDKLSKAYEKLMKSVIKSLNKDMVGFIYTQVSDVEDEVNGLFTFDRKQLKLNAEILKKMNREVDKLYEK